MANRLVHDLSSLRIFNNNIDWVMNESIDPCLSVYSITTQASILGGKKNSRICLVERITQPGMRRYQFSENIAISVKFPHLFAPAMGESNHPLLAAARDIQRYSPDLVIYSRLVGAVVSVSWIMKADGHALKPTGLKDWLRARGLFIECLCPLALDVTPRDPYSCRLVESGTNGDVFAFCHFESEDRGCGMRVTVTAISESTEFFSLYAHFPTTRRRGSANPEVPMQNILALYEEKHQSNLATTPHLDGYIGEQAVFYWPGTEQLASTPCFEIGTTRRRSARKFKPRVDKPLPKPTKRRYIEIDEFDNPSSNAPSMTESKSFPTMSSSTSISRALTHVTKKKKPEIPSTSTGGSSDRDTWYSMRRFESPPVAGPSTRQLSPAISLSSNGDIVPAAASDHDAASNLFDRLLDGRGLTPGQYTNLVKMCTNCAFFFVHHKLEAHTTKCIASDLELMLEPELDSDK
ncbi:hypothetical protein HYPSUDRAFT_59027 [Hypholoma sublateritium FD-334 SS-4]|uniref:Uncharacterized protein n=1 Tax=Hypholoma sublateritium (strain FD-334 SS-4) TaxID=945553 RepID=A0A0D2LW46_HYPSF|nr:hypothetical protein HYPSUDRAFT_59027 [Hypholoma sublateritium FD-334 SS-4]